MRIRPRRSINLATQARYEQYPARRTPWDSRIDELTRFLQETNRAAEYVNRFELGKGAPRHSSPSAAAVWQAYILLEGYSKPPGLTQGGKWQELARILLGNENADLIGYMQIHRELDQPLLG